MRHRLPADRHVVDDHCLQSFGCPVDRGREPGRTGADDDKIGRRLLLDHQVETERLGQIEGAGIAESLLPAHDDPDVTIATGAESIQQGDRGWIFRGQPAAGNAVARHKLPQAQDAGR